MKHIIQSRCRVCVGTELMPPGVHFNQIPETDLTYGVLVHRVTRDQSKDEWVMFCANDPDARHLVRELLCAGRSKQAA